MNDIEKKLEALKAEFLEKLEELQKEAEAQKEQEELKPWKTEIGESYFYISSNFEVTNKVKRTTSFEADRISNGNCFRTKERAEQVAKKMRFLLRLEQLHDQLCPDFEHDYENYYDAKYTIAFNHIERRMKPEIVFDCCESFPVCFESIGAVQKAADILNAELEESK